MKKYWWAIPVIGIILVITTAIISIYLQPRTITEFVYPANAATFGKIAGIAPGNDLTVYIKVKNPELESHSIKISFIKAEESYNLTYDPWGEYDNNGRPLSKISPSILYSPTPSNVENWISVVTSENDTYEKIQLYPLQSKAIPFRINIPSNVKLPKNWYFYLEEKDGDETGFVASRAQTRVLVDMR